MTAITVTAQHIAGGRRDDCGRCPIALAAREAFPHASLIAVDGEFIAIRQDGQLSELVLPAEAGKFVIAFDLGDPVRPFTFDVDLEPVAA